MRINILRNKEVKTIIIKVLIIQVILFLCTILIIKINRNSVLEGVVESKAQFASSLVEKYPELKHEILSLINEKENKDKIEKGKELLLEYGYSTEMDYVLEPIVANGEERSIALILVVSTVILVVGVVIIIMEMKKVYIKVNRAYTYVDEVLNGLECPSLDYEGEGEFPILANEINKMVSVIKRDNEILNKEKEYLQEILTDISHQLKTPLTSITMITDILIDKSSISREKQVEFLNKISTQSEKMEWLIFSLLKIARLDAGSTKFAKENVSLDEVVNVSISLLETKLSEKCINIEVRGDKVQFIGDKEWSTEAITNILKNAIEHSNCNGKVTVIKENNKVFSRLIIKDEGQGISKRDLPNIFKRFYTGTSGRKGESIGIGLAMSKSIIEKQGGYILVKSEEGIGTEFEITFIKNSRL